MNIRIRSELTHNNKIRVFESFSGVGTQAMGLEQLKQYSKEFHNLDIGYEVVGTSDWNIPSIKSYGEIHINHNSDRAKLVRQVVDNTTKEYIIEVLLPLNLSFDDNEVATIDNYRRKKETELRDIAYYTIMGNNLGNIQGIKGSQITDLDLFTFSFPCFTGDTLVLTDKGYKQIVDVEVGDCVLTHTNRFKPVVKTFNNGTQPIYKINAMAFHELKTTSNHKFYVRKRSRIWDNTNRTNPRVFSEPSWVELKDLTKDFYLGVAINTKSIIPQYLGYTKITETGRHHVCNRLESYMNNKDFWWLIGRYIGDGWVRTQGGIIISDNTNKVGEVTAVLERLGFNYNLDINGSETKIHIPFQEIGEFVKQFGNSAVSKHLTSTVLDLPKELLQSFIEGYLGADGYITNKGYHKITSVSKELIYGVAQAVAKVYNTPYAIYFTKRRPTTIIEGRIVNQRDSYELRYKLDKGVQDKAFYEDGYIWFPIKDIKYIGEDTVYDIEVSEDHSFTANGCIVHNCQDISTAGKGQGFKDTTTRSGLVWEVLRILKEQTFEERPKVLLMENVKALTFKKFKEGWEELQEIIKDMGYTNHIKIMDARDYGVAQSRERVIMVSIRNDIDVNYNFPQAFELTKVLRDYLETDVDEKYYLSGEQTSRVVNSKFAQEKNRIHDENSPVSTLLARDWKDPKAVRIEQVGQLYGLGKEKNPVAGRVYADIGLSPTLDTMQGGNRMPIVMTDNVSSGRIVTRDRNNVPRGPQLEVREDDVSNCLTTFSKDSLVVEETVVRKLTPKECWRLMGIPDTYTDKAMKIQSNSQLYKQAGNAIVVDVLYHTFRTLYLEGER